MTKIQFLLSLRDRLRIFPRRIWKNVCVFTRR